MALPGAEPKRLARHPGLTQRQTVAVELVRGGEHGLAEAFSQLADEIFRGRSPPSTGAIAGGSKTPVVGVTQNFQEAT